MDAVTASRPTGCECTVGIAGFGTVGRAVARNLAGGAHPGVRLTHVCNRDVARKRVDWAGEEVVWTDSFQALLDSPVDVIVELIGGQDPARTWIEQALAAGKSVVTANKQVMASCGPALLREAGRHGRHLLFEAAVAVVALSPGRIVGCCGRRPAFVFAVRCGRASRPGHVPDSATTWRPPPRAGG